MDNLVEEKTDSPVVDRKFGNMLIYQPKMDGVGYTNGVQRDNILSITNGGCDEFIYVDGYNNPLVCRNIKSAAFGIRSVDFGFVDDQTATAGKLNTYKRVKEKLKAAIGEELLGKIDGLVIMNGFDFNKSNYTEYDEYWVPYTKWISSGSPYSACMRPDERTASMTLLYMLCEIVGLNGGTVHNFCETPLQAKLSYLTQINIKHYFTRLVKEPEIATYTFQNMHELIVETPILLHSVRNSFNTYRKVTDKDVVMHVIDAKNRRLSVELVDYGDDNGNTKRWCDLLSKYTGKNTKAGFHIKCLSTYAFKGYYPKISTQAEILDSLYMSYATILFPFKDGVTFDVKSFVQAVKMGCLPLIYSSVGRVKEGLASLNIETDDLMDIIIKHLLITTEDFDNLGKKLEYITPRHNQILLDILDTKYFEVLGEIQSTPKATRSYVNKTLNPQPEIFQKAQIEL